MPTINAHFKLKDPNSDEPTLILLKSYFGNQRFVYSTKEYISPSLWDSEIERPTTDRELLKMGSKENSLIKQELKDITLQLNRYVDELDKAYSYLIRQKGFVSPDEMKTILDKEFRKQPEKLKQQIKFLDVYKEFLELSKNKYSERTLKKYRTLQKTLIDFENDTGYQLHFDSIDLVFYDRFNTYLLNKKKAGGTKGLLNDTIGKYIACLKVFMQWSLDRNRHTNTKFTHKEFKVFKTNKNEIVTLTEEEFIRIYSLDLSNDNRLEKVRDLFCFATFVGQRWSDIERFRREDINENWWVFKAYKTKKETKIPFAGWSEPALKILEKYDFKLPVISQQKFNDYIKEVGELAEINTPVQIKRYSGKKEVNIEKPKYAFMSSHMARRTCVTILLERNVPPTTVMKLTGHSDLTTLMKYENTKEDALLAAFKTNSIVK